MGSKRTQDFLLVLSGLSKVANASVKELPSLEKAIPGSSLAKLLASTKIDPPSIEPDLLAKRSALILENSAVMTQSLAQASVNQAIKNMGFVQVQRHGYETVQHQVRSSKDLAVVGEERTDEDFHSDDELPILEPNPSVTSLVCTLVELYLITLTKYVYFGINWGLSKSSSKTGI